VDLAHPRRLRDPDKLQLAEARRRFEAQPRVLAMLAYNSYPAAPWQLDVNDLAAFQAGEAVYVALHWQHALTGDAFITADGHLLEPASPTLADRLRYHADAGRVLAALSGRQHLAAAGCRHPRHPSTPRPEARPERSTP
jgi:hypothetical protein